MARAVSGGEVMKAVCATKLLIGSARGELFTDYGERTQLARAWREGNGRLSMPLI